MLKIQSTVLPPERMTNNVKDGGLWFQDKQTETLKEANKIIKKSKRKDEVKDLCIFIWLIGIASTCLFLIIKNLL